tara:strand:- start:1781 stop:2104 length:324 start_codon:yes stop_codon:yes gene_type:complete
MGLYHNIKGIGAGGDSNTAELISPTYENPISSLNIANVHASANATVTLFIQDNPETGITNTYKIIESVSIPPNASLQFNTADIRPFGFGLYAEIGNSDTVDVIVLKK